MAQPLYKDYIGGVPDEVSPEIYEQYRQEYAVAGVWAEFQTHFDQRLAKWKAAHADDEPAIAEAVEMTEVVEMVEAAEAVEAVEEAKEDAPPDVEVVIEPEPVKGKKSKGE